MENHPAFPLSKYIFFEISKDTIHIYITDGFRAIVFTTSIQSTIDHLCFGISTDEARKLSSLDSSSKLSFIVKNDTLIMEDNGHTQDGVFIKRGTPSVRQFFKTSIQTEIVIDGNTIRHETSLFGTNEQFELTVKHESNSMVLKRSSTGMETVFLGEVKGPGLTRHLNPFFLYPLFLFLKELSTVHFIFHNPFMIEIRDDQVPELTYFVMPIYKKNN